MHTLAFLLTTVAQVPGALAPTGTVTRPLARPRAVTTAPVIDGRLNDPAWHDVPPITHFIQRELHEGQPITERTEVRIITDGQALYVGAWLYDTDAAGIVAGEKVRDGDITKSDYFGILLDTYHDRQNGFVFTTTPAGIEYDAQVVNEGEGGGIQLPGQTRVADVGTEPRPLDSPQERRGVLVLHAAAVQSPESVTCGDARGCAGADA